MIEVFFILIVIYIAYVINATKNAGSKISLATTAGTEYSSQLAGINISTVPKVVEPVVTGTVAKKAAVKVAKSVPTVKEKPKKDRINKKAAPKIELRTVEMKNPKTGEQAKVANNYRMVKRWVKEALVEEGLLEKIYTTKEMDDAAKIKVANALSIIKAMDKYKS